MLAENVDLGPDWVEDDDCGCWTTMVVVDGRERSVHHWIPDDFAPHVPDPECGCGPQLTVLACGGQITYRHVDQDPTDSGCGVEP